MALPDNRSPTALAKDTPSWHDALRLVDSTPLHCGTSRETVKLSDCAGHAGYGYCASHSRSIPQAVSAHLVRRWQDSLQAGIEATQASGEADKSLDPQLTAAAVIAAIEGGVRILLSTGSAAHLEAGLNFCLDRLLVEQDTEKQASARVENSPSYKAEKMHRV